MSDPTGPHGSLLVAIIHQYMTWKFCKTSHTIPNFDLNIIISLCNILDASYDFRHSCDLISPEFTSECMVKVGNDIKDKVALQQLCDSEGNQS